MSSTGKGPRRIAGTLRQRDSGLADLYATAQQLRHREAVMLAELPPQARGHVRLARLDATELVVLADSPEWHHRLRYLAPRLQHAMADRAGVRPARVTIRIGELPRRPRVTEPRNLSPEAGRVIGSAAASIDNPALAAALARLASRAGGDDDHE